MTAAYAAINNGGIYVKPTPFEEILGPNGELLWSRRVEGDPGKRAVNSDIAAMMMWMLQRAVQSGTGGGAALPNRPVAGKTGTSEGGRDLWFIGSIPQLTTGVWLGYDDSRGTKDTSVVATYAWRAFMAPITKNLPVRQFPPRPELQDTYRGGKKPPERAKASYRPGDDLPYRAPQPLELDPSPSLEGETAPIQQQESQAPAAPPSSAPATAPPPVLEAPPPPVTAPTPP